MEYRNLGASGLKLSALGLGTMQWGWRLSKAESFAVMDAFLDRGGNFLDTANIYSQWVPALGPGSSETIIGEWLRARRNRERVALATKVRGSMSERPNDQGLSRRHIVDAVHGSLSRLQTDYIDLYQMHWFDAHTPIEETLETLDSLIRQGKVRYIGCSNYPAWRLMQALWASDKHNWHRFVSLQPHYNLVHREEYERELADACRAYGLGVVPYSPMAGGFLTGKYSRQARPDTPRADSVTAKHDHDAAWRVLDIVLQIAQARGTWPGAVALSWLLTRPNVVAPIVGANSVAQLDAQMEALSLALDANELARLNGVTPDIER